ncbi:hypothetical protein P4H65_00375 [Paenibacillus chitinolyticus]|uniref:hypothetical protein n=1 Tax=Paenibacillus chitinolyticus TaxID=79263 RepID=UPI002DB720A6|nr:hypothetical protein [Paenibacillus chitinolyticus]MEC0244271.1 hypothetical protein [Paenibacillus chitinolyticus]
MVSQILVYGYHFNDRSHSDLNVMQDVIRKHQAEERLEELQLPGFIRPTNKEVIRTLAEGLERAPYSCSSSTAFFGYEYTGQEYLK